jgi:hypothetical protein
LGPWHEYVGSLHLHSCYSDGSGTLREMTAAGARAGVDFFVLTEHDTLAGREDRWQGWHDGVLVIVGVEITCRERSHVVTFGPADVRGLRWKPLRRVLFDLKNQGAAAFVAHAHPAHIMGISLKAGELVDWEVPGFTGVEMWSFLHDICDGLTPWRAPSFIYTWRRYIRGPHPDTLAHWDRITQTRRFAGYGSLDNHAITLPIIGKQILTYEDGFRTLRTHVLTQELPGRPEDGDRVLEAICEGRSFVALDLRADARGFRFEADAPGETLPMGDGPRETLQMGEERPWRGPTVLRIHSPHKADLSLLRNGVPVATSTATDLEFRAVEPGVYRVEARLAGKHWVYTNPIYLRGSDRVVE